MITIVEIQPSALCSRLVCRGERVWIPCPTVAAPGRVCGRLEATADLIPQARLSFSNQFKLHLGETDKTYFASEIEGGSGNRALPSSAGCCSDRRELHPKHESRQVRFGVRAFDPRPNGVRVLVFLVGATPGRVRQLFETEGDDWNKALPSFAGARNDRWELHPKHKFRQVRQGVRAFDPRPNGVCVLPFSVGAARQFRNPRKQKRRVFEHPAPPNQLKLHFGGKDKTYSAPSNWLARIIATPGRIRQLFEIEGGS